MLELTLPQVLRDGHVFETWTRIRWSNKGGSYARAHGWAAPAYAHKLCLAPLKHAQGGKLGATHTTLLSSFDPLVGTASAPLRIVWTSQQRLAAELHRALRHNRATPAP